MENRIMQRAFDIFTGDGVFGRDVENWLQAERELVWRPAVEVYEQENQLRLEVAVPGLDPKSINIEVTAEDLLLQADTGHDHQDKGTVHLCEFQRGGMFRCIHLPKRIDPEKVKAEFKNGMLYLTAKVAEEAKAKKVSIEAA
jgi:HSP20 family protein